MAEAAVIQEECQPIASPRTARGTSRINASIAAVIVGAQKKAPQTNSNTASHRRS